MPERVGRCGHAIVVGHHLADVVTQSFGGGQVDRVERAKFVREQRPSDCEDAIVDPHQIASSYQSAGALTSRLSGYVDSVAAFDNYSLSGFSLSSSEISTGALEIAIQPGIGSSAQMAALNNVIAYGSSQGIVVRVMTVP